MFYFADITVPGTSLPVGAHEGVKEYDFSQGLSSPDLRHSLQYVSSVGQHQYCLSGNKLFSPPIPGAERTALRDEVENLRKERDDLAEELSKDGDHSLECRLDADYICRDDYRCRYYTGLSGEVCKKLFNLSMIYTKSRSFDESRSSASGLSAADQFILCLVRLRQDIPLEYLSHQKGVSISTASDAFSRWIDILHQKVGWLVR